MGQPPRVALATLLLAVLLLAACSGGVTVRGQIVHPAQVPVRAFPRILVTAAEDAESREIALALARHLSVGRSAVDRVDREAIETLRAEGRIERATVVLELSATIVQRDRPEWSREGEPECGPMGCFDGRRATVEAVPELTAHLVLTVADGPSGRSLQEVELEEQETGADVLAMRMRVLERLGQQVRALVDQRVEHVAVDLYPVSAAEVRRALEAVGRGRWDEGRRALEQLVRSPRFARLSREERALVFYDLGQARRFDATLPPERRFRGASRALRAAVRLVPQPLYARAIAELEAHRRNRAMVLEQQEAMAHNFRLSREGRSDTPPNYED